MKSFLLDQCQWVPIRSVLLLIIGLFLCWLVGLLVGKAVLSERALSIFLIFYMTLEEYEGRKVTEPDFWKKFLIWRYLRKDLQISPKSDTLIFFSKTAATMFLIFGLKLLLNVTFNLSETYFSKKVCDLEIFDLEVVKKLPRLRFLAIFSTLHH